MLVLGLGSWVVIRVRLLHRCVELIPVPKHSLPTLPPSPTITKLPIPTHPPKRYLLPRTLSPISQPHLTPHLFILLQLIFSLWILLHVKVRYGVWMVPALILIMLVASVLLVSSPHPVHSPILENVIRQWLVCLCSGLLLKMLVLGVADV